MRDSVYHFTWLEGGGGWFDVCNCFRRSSFVRSSKSWELKHLVIGHVDLWEMIKLYDYVVANNIEDIFLIFHWRYFALIAVTFNVIVVYFYI